MAHQQRLLLPVLLQEGVHEFLWPRQRLLNHVYRRGSRIQPASALRLCSFPNAPAMTARPGRRGTGGKPEAPAHSHGQCDWSAMALHAETIHGVAQWASEVLSDKRRVRRTRLAWELRAPSSLCSALGVKLPVDLPARDETWMMWEHRACARERRRERWRHRPVQGWALRLALLYLFAALRVASGDQLNVTELCVCACCRDVPGGHRR